MTTQHASATQSMLERYYRDGYASWDIGRPQKSISKLVETTRFRDPVLDLGCGTGEHAFLLASKGLQVTGVDISPTAIRRAEEKQKRRVEKVTFVRADVLKWTPSDGTKFGTVLDVGMFHCLGPAAVPKYVRKLSTLLRPGGELFLMCIAESPHDEPRWPYSHSRRSLQEIFSEPRWHVRYIESAVDESTFSDAGLRALLMNAELREIVG